MFKIAYSGMKGRKRDSVINGLIIVLAIVFVIVSTSVFSSMSETKRKTMMQTFGVWKEMGVVSKASLSKAETVVEGGSTMRILGRADRFGLVGSLDDAFQTLGNVRLIEGRFPIENNEVVIEYGQTARFEKGIAIGETIDMEVEIPVRGVSRPVVLNELNRLFKEKYAHYLTTYVAEHPEDPVYDYVSIYPEYFKRAIFHNDMLKLNEIQQTEQFDTFKVGHLRALRADTLQDYLIKQLTTEYKSSILNVKAFDDFTINAVQKSSRFKLKPFVKSSVYPYPKEEDYKKVSLITDDLVRIVIPVKVVGFMDDYNENWTKNKINLPNTLMTDALYDSVVNAFYEMPYYDSTKYAFPQIHLSGASFSESERAHMSQSVVNTGFYKDGITAQTGVEKEDAFLVFTILGLIFLTTMIAMFQVNLFQIRRRVRRFGLLKAIGATKKQLNRILISEVILYVMVTVPMGVVLGLGTSYGVIKGINQVTTLELIYDVKVTWILFGIVITILSVLLGMSYSFFKALRAPFNAQMSIPQRHYKLDKKKTLYKPGVILSFRKISAHQMRAHYKKNLLMFFLCTVVITALLGSIVIAYVFYIPYMDDVIIKNIPDFSITLPHGLRTGHLNETREKLLEIDGVVAAEALRSGNETYANIKNIFESEPFDQSVSVYNRNFNNFKYSDIMKRARRIDAYGISVEGDLFRQLQRESLGNDFDVDEFERGNTIILLLPRYDQGDFSMNFKYKHLYNERYDVNKGDFMTLLTPLEFTTEDPAQKSFNRTNAAVARYYRVDAIVHGFDQLGVWPFSEMNTVPIALTSEPEFKKLYRNNGFTYKLTVDEIESLVDVFYPNAMGKIVFTIKMDEQADVAKVYAEIRKVSREWGVKTHNHITEKQVAKQKAFKMMIIVLIFGISIASVAMMIIFNLIQIKVENERERIGILQAIGVHAGQFRALYRLSGVLFGLFSLVIAFLTSYALTLIFVGRLSDIIKSEGLLLYQFPWIFALVVSGIYIALCAGIHYKPVAKVIKNQPIYNIQVNQN